MTDYEFTFDMFSHNIDTWNGYKEHLTSVFGNDLLCLELGAYEGKSAIYILDNFVGEKGHLHVIDWFVFNSTKVRFTHNISLHPKQNQVTLHEGSTAEKLPTLIPTLMEKVNFIYIDAGKTAIDNIISISLAERLLTVNGLLVVDDYGWENYKQDPKVTPKPAVDWFIENSLLCEPYALGYQATFIKKKSNNSMLSYGT